MPSTESFHDYSGEISNIEPVGSEDLARIAPIKSPDLIYELKSNRNPSRKKMELTFLETLERERREREEQLQRIQNDKMKKISEELTASQAKNISQIFSNTPSTVSDTSKTKRTRPKFLRPQASRPQATTTTRVLEKGNFNVDVESYEDLRTADADDDDVSLASLSEESSSLSLLTFSGWSNASSAPAWHGYDGFEYLPSPVALFCSVEGSDTPLRVPQTTHSDLDSPKGEGPQATTVFAGGIDLFCDPLNPPSTSSQNDSDTDVDGEDMIWDPSLHAYFDLGPDGNIEGACSPLVKEHSDCEAFEWASEIGTNNVVSPEGGGGLDGHAYLDLGPDVDDGEWMGETDGIWRDVFPLGPAPALCEHMGESEHGWWRGVGSAAFLNASRMSCSLVK